MSKEPSVVSIKLSPTKYIVNIANLSTIVKTEVNNSDQNFDQTLTGDNDFFDLLEKEWIEIKCIKIPTWKDYPDAMHFYIRK